jgi:uncharacterized protein Yka (UPF0111/DUF47 family)
VKRVARWFLHEEPDVLGILRRQAGVTLEGMEAFARWSESGEEAAALLVRDAEHRADEVRRELLEQLSAALTTRVDQEDVYWLSERLDAVINKAKNTVREAEVLGVGPDDHTNVMGASALVAARRLNNSLFQLAVKDAHPGAEADAAVKAARQIEKEYRTAIAALPAQAGAKELVSRREIYRGYTEIADAVVRVATRVWYAVLKVS